MEATKGGGLSWRAKSLLITKKEAIHEQQGHKGKKHPSRDQLI
jgi:hypothetical protein